MLGRLWLLRVATLLLYLGPLLAGLSGMGWSAVPVFVALMALWLVVMRPHQWPRAFKLWTPAVGVAAAAQVTVNALVVVILFGIGRGLGGMAGFELMLSPLVPVAFSFLSIPLSRLVWDPVVRDEIGNGAEPAEDPMLTALLNLPDDADPVLTTEAIRVAMEASGAARRLLQLEDALKGSSQRTGLREGLILWATDPTRAADDQVRGAPKTGFLAAGPDARLLDLFARRAVPQLMAQPGLWSSFPDRRAIVLALDGSQPHGVQESLRALAVAVEAATPPEARLNGA